MLSHRSIFHAKYYRSWCLNKPPFVEIYCSAFSNGHSSSHKPLLTNLNTHLIIRISKGQAIDRKRETNGEQHENQLSVRVSKQELHKALQVDVLRES